MKKLTALAVFVGLLAALAGANHRVDANPTPQILTGILNKMEKAHQEMKSLRAELIQQKTNPQINITDTSQGALLYKPAGGRDRGKARVDYVKPSKDVFSIVGENVTFYQPRINQVFKNTLAKTAKGKVGGLSQLIGLDGSLKSLGGNYNIDYVKDEAINGQMTTVLRLTPKNGGSSFASVDLWVNHQSYLPAQWKFTERNGDYTVVTLKNVQLNTNIPDSAFAVNVPSGTKVVDKF
jgi:outer membrane lipoprotein-sorting protein